MIGLFWLFKATAIKLPTVCFVPEYRRKAAQWIDKRVKVMNEIISGISVIKMYTWENPFADRVEWIRR